MFDLTAAEGTRRIALSTPDVTAMQAIWLDQNGTLWCTQPTRDSAGSGNETTVLSRLDNDGTLLDSMTLEQGGHGVSLAIDDDRSSEPTVYFNWQYSPSRDLVRFPYRPGTTIDQHDQSVERVWPGPIGFFAVNMAADRIAIRDQGDGGEAVCHLRRWSDVLNGVDEELARIAISASHPRRGHTFQGLAVDPDFLYELTGDANPDRTEPTYIWRHRWSDGNADRRDVSDLGRSDDGPSRRANEPEGITFANIGGEAPRLLVGLAQGRRATRRQVVVHFEMPGGTK